MDPIVQTTPTSRVSEEGPTAAKGTVAAKPETAKSVVKPGQSILPTHKGGVAGKLLSSSDDLIEETVTVAKSLSKPGINDRKSPRCPVPPDRQPCELKVGANVLSASLVNESKGGFAVLIDRLDGIKTGKKVELVMKTRSFTVKVVHITKVAPPENAPPECNSWFRLGMKKTGGSLFSFFS